MTVVLKIPTKVGTERSPIKVQHKRKLIGNLSNKPIVKDGKLFAGKLILVARDHQKVYHNPGPHLSAYFFKNGAQQNIMEVRYGSEVASYQLYEDPVVYSDGPPHPDHLQLGVRVGASGGVTEPEGS